MHKKLDEKIEKMKNLTDFSFNSINLFEFHNENEKEDENALKEIIKIKRKEKECEIISERRIKENKNYCTIDQYMPDFHFYEGREILSEFFEK